MVVEEEDDGMDDKHLEVVVHCDTGSCDRVACDEGRSGLFPIDTEEDALQDNRSSGTIVWSIRTIRMAVPGTASETNSTCKLTVLRL
jgi:hypothetical protein